MTGLSILRVSGRIGEVYRLLCDGGGWVLVCLADFKSVWSAIVDR